MRWRNGFLLLEAAIYSALMVSALIFFMRFTHFFAQWYAATPTTLHELLYHQRSIAIMSNDLAASDSCSKDDTGKWHIQGHSSDHRWQIQRWEIIYEHRPGGVYRSIIKELSDKQTRSAVRLTGPLAKIDITQPTKESFLLLYQPQGGTEWLITIPALIALK
jgi:hypothetical protein